MNEILAGRCYPAHARLPRTWSLRMCPTNRCTRSPVAHGSVYMDKLIILLNDYAYRCSR